MARAVFTASHWIPGTRKVMVAEVGGEEGVRAHRRCVQLHPFQHSLLSQQLPGAAAQDRLADADHVAALGEGIGLACLASPPPRPTHIPAQCPGLYWERAVGWLASAPPPTTSPHLHNASPPPITATYDPQDSALPFSGCRTVLEASVTAGPPLNLSGQGPPFPRSSPASPTLAPLLRTLGLQV